jgi:hypothetical protein
MEFKEQKASCEKARQIDMVAYLAGLGYEPVKIRNLDYWYLSPLRSEKIPSFKVNQKLNRWYDHGLGKGGNLIDFALLYYGCTVGEFLKMLSGNLSFHQPLAKVIQPPENTKESQIHILRQGPISAISLCHYLQRRSIPLEIARRYCQEVRYQLQEKEYVALGFKNDAGGYELRNPYFKASSSPKDMTTIKNGGAEATVFEGFFDFLSYQAMPKNQPEKPTDFLILNSVSFFQKARPILENYPAIHLYLDRDNTGKNVTREALKISPKYGDKSSLYRLHKDLNDWLVNQNQGRVPKKNFKPKPQ